MSMYDTSVADLVRIRIIFPDPDPFISVSGSYSKEHNKINRNENLTKCACWAALGGPSDKEN